SAPPVIAPRSSERCHPLPHLQAPCMPVVVTADAAQLITQGLLTDILQGLQRRFAGNKKGCRSILLC
ncbi:MAG: hypothetical protein ACRDDF_03115, partial [Aeromonas sp.]